MLLVLFGALLTYKDFLSDHYVLPAQGRTIDTRTSVRSVMKKGELRKVDRGPQTPQVIEKKVRVKFSETGSEQQM